MLVLRRTPLLVAIFAICVLPRVAAAESRYVHCDNGLRCVMAPCPSNSALDLATGRMIKGVSIDIDGLPQEDKALDLSDKLRAGKVVVVGSIENRTQTLNGMQYALPWLVATSIERASSGSERGHCSSQ
jgi:hypothetical protein